MSKKKPVEDLPIVNETIYDESLEEIMGTRYGTYAKYVIQERAIPDVRDGLKPVQRRIIYAMQKAGLTFNAKRTKCARIVGDVMGHYHPHGDTSIYDAIVRMAQEWKVNCPLIDFQGNKGSIDGDVAAAYRYTEARLSQIAEEMVRDYDKDTVDMVLTYDDSQFEPTVLPSRFPNLLVNGSEGIAVALATEIPTHNLSEVVEAIIYRLNHVNVEVSDLLQFVKGPDFPTGGIIFRSKGLEDIYTLGRGKIEIAGKTEIVQKKDINQIVISEIPFKVQKINLVYEIDRVRYDRSIGGILEVRDESDRHSYRIVVDLKKEAKAEVILQYLMNKTSLKTSYSANMVAIVDGHPKTMSLLDFIDSYIAHQLDVLTRRSTFLLGVNNKRLHIVDGLIRAISILDDVVKTIRASKDKADAKHNLEGQFGFTQEQSEAIVTLQLYRLTNTDISVLEDEKKKLEADNDYLHGLLEDPKKMRRLLINDLKTIVAKYGVERKTVIQDKSDAKTFTRRDLITAEESMIAITRDGYIKRSTVKSYRSSGDNALPGLKDGDALVYSGKAMTTDYIVAFTSTGNFLFIPVYEILESKWKDEGKHINYLISLKPDDKIVRAFAINKFRDDLFFVIVSLRGQIKRVPLSYFQAVRYTRPIMCMKLLNDDEVVDVAFTNGNSLVWLASSAAESLLFKESDITLGGLRGGGVKSMSNLKGAKVVSMLTFDADEPRGKIILISEYASVRIFELANNPIANRLNKSFTLYKYFKNDPHPLVFATKVKKGEETKLFRCLLSDKTYFELTVDDFHLTPMDRYAKAQVKLPHRASIELVYKEGDDYIDDKIIAKAVNIKEETSVSKLESTDTTQKEEDVRDSASIGQNDDDSQEENYEQISIFDDDLDL